MDEAKRWLEVASRFCADGEPFESWPIQAGLRMPAAVRLWTDGTVIHRRLVVKFLGFIIKRIESCDAVYLSQEPPLPRPPPPVQNPLRTGSVTLLNGGQCRNGHVAYDKDAKEEPRDNVCNKTYDHAYQKGQTGTKTDAGNCTWRWCLMSLPAPTPGVMTTLCLEHRKVVNVHVMTSEGRRDVLALLLRNFVLFDENGCGGWTGWTRSLYGPWCLHHLYM